jgi:lysophospholipase L1-like esterase
VKKTIFFFCFSIVQCAVVAQGKVTNQNLFDTIPFMVDHYAKRTAQFDKEPIVIGKIVFLGNSITEGGPWGELIGDNTVINRGIGGDITFTVLKRLDDVIKRKPAKVFILIGINDIGKDIPDAVIADNCRKIVQRIKAGSPQTTIFLQSILPLNPSYLNFPQHYDKENHVIHTNMLLRQVAESTQCRFVNLYPLFLDDQQRLDKKFTGDGLHLNRAAYEVWVNFLKQTGCL